MSVNARALTAFLYFDPGACGQDRAKRLADPIWFSPDRYYSTGPEDVSVIWPGHKPRPSRRARQRVRRTFRLSRTFAVWLGMDVVPELVRSSIALVPTNWRVRAISTVEAGGADTAGPPA